MTRRAVRVVKVGGSLLDFDRLSQELPAWLAAQPPAANILLAGGGRLADLVREMDARFGVGEEASHWLCVGAMSLSAKFLAALLPRAQLAAGLAELRRAIEFGGQRTQPLIFDPELFLRGEEPLQPGAALPHSWSVTSDSIAARLAEVIGAEELVLLKSTDPPGGLTKRSAACAGYTDPYFPLASGALPAVRCVNLRAAPWTEWLLR